MKMEKLKAMNAAAQQACSFNNINQPLRTVSNVAIFSITFAFMLFMANVDAVLWGLPVPYAVIDGSGITAFVLANIGIVASGLWFWCQPALNQ